MKPADLDGDLVKQIFKDLKEATGKGYGKSFYNYDRNAKRKLERRQNLFRFSGAKTYQELAKLNFLLQGDDGEPRPFSEFQKEALKLNEQYNRHYLQTEYNSAQRAGAMAEKWAKYEDQKGVYPNLQYKTAKDNRVREDHANIDDVIKPIDDKFWDKWYPPNGFNCRCYVVQTSKPATKGTPKAEPTPGFENNVGKDGRTFNEDHPYFLFPEAEVSKIRKGFEELKLLEPMYEEIFKKGSGNIQSSVWADPKDIDQNLANSKILVNSLKAKVKIRPHVNSSILKGKKNPELEVNGKVADLKNLTSNNGITNAFKSAKKQMGENGNYSIVFNLDGIKKIDLNSFKQQLNNKISPERGKKIASIFFTLKEKALEITRAKILKRDYKDLEEFLKD